MVVVADGDGTGDASDNDDELPEPGASTLCFGDFVASLLALFGDAIEPSASF